MKTNIFCLSFLLLFSIVLKAQNYDSLKTLFIHKNVSPQQTQQDSQKSTPAVTKSNILAPSVFCGGVDMHVLPSSNPQSEVHISVDKTAPKNVLASANTYTTNYNQGYYYTTNSGTSWAGADQLSGSTVLYGDPSTAYDANGNVFIASMIANLTAQDADGYFIQKSTNNGSTWSALLRASDTRLNFDKEMIAADDYSTSPYKNNIYGAWTDFTAGSLSVRFNRSTNGGTSFSTPITLKNSNGLGQGTNVQTGPNGEVYVCWTDYTNYHLPGQGIGFTKSTNGGVSFSAATVPISYVGIRMLAGPDPAFNYTRVNDFPSMAVDKSSGAHKGRIYIVFAARENGTGKAVVQITWSDNGGSTWTTPKTISLATGRQNWFPWIAVDDANGKIYVDYYSLDQAAGFSTNTYVAYSYDGGATFQNQLVSDVPHITQPINNALFAFGYAGDYIGMTGYNKKVYAAWMDNRSGVWQIYVSRIYDLDISGNDYFCVSSSYSVSNLPAGAVVTWSVSPSGVGNLSCTTCSQTTLSKNSVSPATLTATIDPGCGMLVTINKNVSVGFAPITVSSTPTGACSGTYETWFESATPSVNATNYLWTVDYLGNNSDINIISPNTSSTNVDVSGGGALKLTYTDICGNNKFDGATIYSHCNGPGASSFSIVPNPAVNNFRIESENRSFAKNDSKNLIYAIKISDHFGTQQKLFQYKSGITSATISLTDMKSGVYLVSVFDGYAWSSKSLIVEK